MSIPVLIELAVAEATIADLGVVSLADAVTVAEAAELAGVTAIRLLDHAGPDAAIDPTVVGSYLAGRRDGHSALGYLVDVPTTHQAPYNLARRVLSLDRATAGRVGVVLRPGQGDEVSDATPPDPSASDPAERWSEYAGILTRLWESFPREALIGDQERALVVDDALIRPIDHEGRFYRVAGPLDGPSSVQGRPVVAADLDVLDWDALAESVDVVIVERSRSEGADLALTAALEHVGRRRDDVVLVGRTPVTLSSGSEAQTVADELMGWVESDRLDGLDLVPTGGPVGALAVVRTLAPRLASPVGPTLRASLGLREVAEVLA